MKKEDICKHCGHPIKIRNPSGHCDHLYYPDNCKVCQGLIKKEKMKKEPLKDKRKQLGKKASHWKGGRIIVDGYVYIYSPNHPNRTQDKYVCEHRLVMEKHLGRYLKPEEVVHHKNGIKTDNRIENLELCESTGKHFIKNHLKDRDKLGRFM